MAGIPLPGTHWELRILQNGNGPVCGVDEVGRGPLAGPVVAAAVILPLRRSDCPSAQRLNGSIGAVTTCEIPDALRGLNDSKKLSASKRQHFLRAIRATAIDMHIGMASPREIEHLNIRQATLLAMSRAIRGLALESVAFILVDGRDLPTGLPCQAQAIVRGDQESISIAAASIVAKEVRDALMVTLAIRYPGYGWEHNRGYPTAEHLRALHLLGITEQHRRSFAPVRNVIEMAKQ